MQKIILNDQSKVGVTWFIPEQTFTKGVPCKGVIREVYAEGSVYIGDGEYDGSSFFRQGHGIQYFKNSTLKGAQIGAPNNCKLDRFVGGYDRFKCDWMYGNGVWYFTDLNGNPIHFCKGFFFNTYRIDDWHGDFDYDCLLLGYTKDMEVFELDKFFNQANDLQNKYAEVHKCSYLFMGDSWIDFWRDEQCFSRYGFIGKGYDFVNVGIGGTTYKDWTKWIDKLVVCHNPDKILINLGFNDLHHGQTVNQVYNYFLKVVTEIHKALPNAKIFVTSLTHCSVFTRYFDSEIMLNGMIADFAKQEEYITYLPVGDLFKKDGKIIEDMDDYCIEDRLHLNQKGYAVWGKYIIENIAK